MADTITLRGERLDLVIVRGKSLLIDIRPRILLTEDPPTFGPFVAALYQPGAQIRLDPGDPGAALATFGFVATEEGDGWWISLTPDQTRGLNATTENKMDWDFEVTRLTDGFVKEVYFGTVEVLDEVTI